MLELVSPAPAVVEVVVSENFARDPRTEVALSGLYPEEREQVARTVEVRRQQFALVRFCARRALPRLGLDPVALPRGPRGAPQWPAGVAGSMTHTDGFCGAVVALRSQLAGLGVDAELATDLSDGVFQAVARPEERSLIGELCRDRPDVPWGRVLFSAKESVYKTWFPLTGRVLKFEQVSVGLSADKGDFTVDVLIRDPAYDRLEIRGRWARHAGTLVTAVTAKEPQ